MAERALVMSKRDPVKIDTIEIDACIEETHTLANTVTDHPVETGFNITDHCRPNPDTVTLRCFVSNTPLSQDQMNRSVREGNFDNSDITGDIPIGQVDGRGDKAFKALKKLRDEGTLITVVTTLKTYQADSSGGLIIESLTVPRTTKNFDGLEFSVTLKQVRVVQTKTTRVRTKQSDKRNSKKEHKGQQTPKPPEQETSAFRGTVELATGRLED